MNQVQQTSSHLPIATTMQTFYEKASEIATSLFTLAKHPRLDALSKWAIRSSAVHFVLAGIVAFIAYKLLFQEKQIQKKPSALTLAPIKKASPKARTNPPLKPFASFGIPKQIPVAEVSNYFPRQEPSQSPARISASPERAPSLQAPPLTPSPVRERSLSVATTSTEPASPNRWSPSPERESSPGNLLSVKQPTRELSP